jgi:PAS domain S-box-containing protein
VNALRDAPHWAGISPEARGPFLTRADVKGYAISFGAVALALASTRLTWPLFARTPLILLFGAAFTAARFGTEASGLLAIAFAAFGAAYVAAPPGAPPVEQAALMVFITGAVILNRIVVGRNRAVRSFYSSEAQFRAAWESAAIGAALLNRQGQVERLNPAMERLLGYPSTAWSGVPLGYFSHPDDAVVERATFNELISGACESAQREQRYRRRDGAIIWGRVTMSLIRGTDHRPSAVLVMVEDVTSRHIAEEQLSASEEQFRGLFEGVPVGLFQSTPLGKILAANPALAAMLGYGSSTELLGRQIGELYADPDARRALRAALDAGRDTIRNDEVMLRRTDGRPLVVAMSARAVRDTQGVLRYYEGSVLDLTDRLELETQLLHAQKQDALGRLVSGVAHDFNNLLTAIGGYTELALGQLGPDAQRGDLEEILKASHRATALTRQLMSFSRRSTLKAEVISLNEVIESIGTLVQRLIGNEIEVSFVLAPDLLAMKADPGHIEQVVVNLAVNARDAMPKGGRLVFETKNVMISTSGSTPGRADVSPYVRLIVSDSGSGMGEQVKARLFEPFFTTKELGKGTGLGLATVASIVKRAGGHIGVTSELGRGTTFEIDFPNAAAAEKSHPASGSQNFP